MNCSDFYMSCSIWHRRSLRYVAARSLTSQRFLHELHHFFSPEVTGLLQHDIVYTFFHPMLRDEQDINKTNIEKLKGTYSYPLVLTPARTPTI